MPTPIQVVIDCADPEALAAFWAAALGYKVQDAPEGYATWRAFESATAVPETDRNSWSAIVDPGGVGPRIYFHRVPEPKAAKNRLHLDLDILRDVPPDLQRKRLDDEVERLRQLGATALHAVEEGGEHWVTMLDPEGNEFDLM
jgi:hypothetical protein